MSCTCTGWSRPRLWRICSRSAGVALTPASAALTSPGMSRISPKVMSVTSSTTGIAPAMRRRMTRPTPLPPSPLALYPHVRETPDSERLEALHLGGRRLHFGERAERHGIDPLQDGLLHEREGRLAVGKVGLAQHVRIVLDQVGVGHIVLGIEHGLRRHEELHGRERAQRRLCPVTREEEIPARALLELA